MSFDVLVIGKKVFLESRHRIYKHLDSFVEFLDLQISVNFELCIDEEFIEFGWAGIIFESPNSTNIVECPPSNGGAFLLTETTVLEF